MQPAITLAPSALEHQNTAFLLQDSSDLSNCNLSEAERIWAKQQLEGEATFLPLNRYGHWVYLIKAPKKKENGQQAEGWRLAGH
ncbi:MAG: peptidase M17, partial [Bacteroidetes bacterium]|nr:peptidase M17 [Bacteroidota bacterium]